MPVAFAQLADGHTPSSAALAPPGWRPQFLYSQQLFLLFMAHSFL
jgi:hypothetical protein